MARGVAQRSIGPLSCRGMFGANAQLSVDRPCRADSTVVTVVRRDGP
jgi:hypothetical protein